MTIQIWLYRTNYVVSHALKTPETVDNLLGNNHFDLVIIQVEGSSFSLEKLFLILLKHNIKILLMSSDIKSIKKWKLTNNIIQVLQTPFNYQSLFCTLHQLIHPGSLNDQLKQQQVTGLQ
ncbi:hypothetical protein [Lacihabitans soyangensis]|uniref:Uncharacterized protein n=1 Tax=Lacihabitans soyangensis TaxID=869394 RepID=A0AAE3H6R5_9BACT|nr:hypothetical protein [Lacihabitans soyangensis]MCP9764025.1 hypothetical protein [Lacihabitans soyangensis]